MIKVLVVDDEPQILRALRINLRAHGYDVSVAADGAAALRAAASVKPDLVILDLGLPDIDGVSVVEGLRGWTSIPILILSGRANSADKIAALDAGADDYVTKPFDIGELLARVRAVTRRRGAGESQPAITIGDSQIDLTAHTVKRGDEEVRLTPTEWQLLEVLLRNPGKLVSQRQLLHEVWGPSYDRETNYLRQYLAQLRRKLERDPARPAHLLTEPGMGYRYKPLGDEGDAAGFDPAVGALHEAVLDVDVPGVAAATVDGEVVAAFGVAPQADAGAVEGVVDPGEGTADDGGGGSLGGGGGKHNGRGGDSSHDARADQGLHLSSLWEAIEALRS